MKPIYASLWIFVCLLAVSARAQDSGVPQSPKNIVFDVKIIDTEVRTPEAMEEIARNPNSLNQKLAEGKAKLIAGTKVYALLNQRTILRNGQRVPIQTASLPAFQPPRSANQSSGPSPTGSGVAQGLAPMIPQIQYENTGLMLEFEPRSRRDATLELLFKIELTLLSLESGRLTPTFLTRNLSGVINLKPNQPPIVLEIFQNDSLAQSASPSAPVNSLGQSFVVLLSVKTVE